jgi:bifunctional DNA-binding transcriptional regulator/antitoxin component of YhaV-PrlF toxin-antitoxin module
MMSRVLTVTAKGQVTLRREVLEHLGISPGDKLIVELLPSGRAEVRAARTPGSIEGFIGSLKTPRTRSLSIDEMNEIAAQGWAGR